MFSINLSIGIKVYCIFVTALTGAVFGSFFNCMAWRITHGQNVLKGRSFCPKCKKDLGVMDLVPVFSWIFSGGKCRYCKEKISWRYPMSEVILALLSVLLLLKFDISLEFLKYLIFTYCLFTLSITDLDDYIIPDSLLVIPAISWLILSPFTQLGIKDIVTHLLAGVLLGAIILAFVLLFDRLTNKESMGGGDIKLFALCGLYLGTINSLFMLFFACVIGLVFALITKYRNSNEEKHFPFGPAIAIATWLMFMHGEKLVNWYLKFL